MKVDVQVAKEAIYWRGLFVNRYAAVEFAIAELVSRAFLHEAYAQLRPVEIHREFITAAARWMMAAKLWSVFSARMAMRFALCPEIGCGSATFERISPTKTC